eukprot:114478-Chlamydomonas_euryale.AAC.1
MVTLALLALLCCCGGAAAEAPSARGQVRLNIGDMSAHAHMQRASLRMARPARRRKSLSRGALDRSTRLEAAGRWGAARRRRVRGVAAAASAGYSVPARGPQSRKAARKLLLDQGGTKACVKIEASGRVRWRTHGGRLLWIPSRGCCDPERTTCREGREVRWHGARPPLAAATDFTPIFSPELRGRGRGRSRRQPARL